MEIKEGYCTFTRNVTLLMIVSKTHKLHFCNKDFVNQVSVNNHIKGYLSIQAGDI